MIGETIGHYRVLEKLGEGGMGVVYKAQDIRLDRFVALKVLALHLLTDDDATERFEREAKAAGGLDHANVATVFEIGQDNGRSFIAMQFVEGPTIADKIKDRPLPLDEALELAIQVAEGLQDAHEKGVVHRDIKAANIILTRKGQAKITDFGLAYLAERTKLTKSGTTMGTPASMSPEQAQGRSVDHRSDIWSLGVLLYEMVTGQQPFLGDYEQAVAYSIINEDPEPVTALRSGLPKDLDRVIDKALAKPAAERYQHVDELLVDLRRLQREPSARTSTIGRTQSRPPEIRRRALVVPAVLLVAASATLTWLLVPRSQPVLRPRFQMLTAGAGLSDWPVASRDGNLFAYSSDRGVGGNFDIWVQQAGGGQPVRVTDDPAQDTEPDFSPDGRLIAFYSDRQPAGIYLVAALGGSPRLLAADGRGPRFSPDGNHIAYWVGSSHSDDSKSYVVPVEGGTPQQIQPEFSSARNPIWSPDGGHLLFYGANTAADAVRRTVEGLLAEDWWVTPFGGGEAINTDSSRLFGPLGLEVFEAADWAGESVVFWARSGNGTGVWKVPLSHKDYQVMGTPEPLISGSGMDTHPRCAWGDRLVFAGLQRRADIWELPVNLNAGEVTGDLRSLTSSTAFDDTPSFSDSSDELAFLSDRSGTRQVWIKEIATGRETQLTFGTAIGNVAIISSDGSKIAFRYYEDGRPTLRVVPARGGVAEPLCDECGYPLAWWPTGSKRLLSELSIIAGQRRTTAIAEVDTETREVSRLLEHPEERTYDAVWSPDGRWLAFHTTHGQNRKVYVAPYDGPTQIPHGDWIAITDGSAIDRAGLWSPDGNLIYLNSNRDGYGCIWAQRLDPRTRRPAGEPFGVYHFHSGRYSQPVGGRNLSMTSDSLVFARVETTGNVWLMEPITDAP